MDNGLFKNIEQKTGVRMKDVLELANSLQHANFKDEKTVRGVIKKVSKLANKSVPQRLEDQIVQSIIKDGKKLDIQTITDMVNKKK
ncbi:stage VI sporulation protein F [Bacillus xiapuensis]|uniref:stage VI sporulation protein F n=1 Tax=Bacillus xiapuensis TaxID=2014075 RepID=UPI000C2339C6|nr:stage VI sporulation protein F [Bacillus xiapuensis]